MVKIVLNLTSSNGTFTVTSLGKKDSIFEFLSLISIFFRWLDIASRCYGIFLNVVIFFFVLS